MPKTLMEALTDGKIKNENHIYGPDYYARQASLPSGGKNRSGEGKWPEWSAFNRDVEENNNDDSWVTVDPLPPPLPKDKPPRIEEIIEEFPLDTHQPQPEVESKTEFIITEVTSDSDASYVNFYDVKKSEVYKKTKDDVTDHEIKTTPFEKNKQQLITKYNKTTKHDAIRRHKSDSDLLAEDSFDAPPKVLSKKRDNTLISKIYSNPQVRNFALSTRKEVPVDGVSSPDAFSASIYETNRYNGSVTLYNSEGETSHIRKSSTENLLESIARPWNYNRSTSAIIGTYGRRTNSFSSEEDVLSEHSASAKTNSKNHIYSSSDDLFSIEEQDRPQKKKDNTLIDKIYQNPQVRSYALANRDYIPVQEEDTVFKKSYSSEDETFEVKPTTKETLVSKPVLSPTTPKAFSQKKGTEKSSSYGLHLMSEMDLDKAAESYYQKELAVALAEAKETPKTEIDEIEEISKKKIVHNLLDVYSKSTPVIAPRKKLVAEKKDLVSDSECEINVSVKELRKKFEHNNVKKEVKSSLTARSLSKKVREELKH